MLSFSPCVDIRLCVFRSFLRRLSFALKIIQIPLGTIIHMPRTNHVNHSIFERLFSLQLQSTPKTAQSLIVISAYIYFFCIWKFLIFYILFLLPSSVFSSLLMGPECLYGFRDEERVRARTPLIHRIFECARAGEIRQLHLIVIRKIYCKCKRIDFISIILRWQFSYIIVCLAHEYFPFYGIIRLHYEPTKIILNEHTQKNQPK